MGEKEFEGKVVLLTGGASGVGRASARAFAEAGARVVLADIDANGLNGTLDLIKELGGQGVALPADISDAGACAELVAEAVTAFGKLDALCNIAGVLQFNHAVDITPEQWDRIFAVNVRGPFFLIQAAFPHLVAQSGAVVNVASASAFFGHSYLAPYAASKAALVSLTQSLAMEWMNEPVRINAVAPGAVATPMAAAAATKFPEGIDMHLLGRYAPLRGPSSAEEIADIILLLAGERGRAMHGACINADRGTTAG